MICSTTRRYATPTWAAKNYCVRFLNLPCSIETAPRSGFLWPAIPGGHPAGRRCATLKMIPDHFLWPGLHRGHPLGRRCATLKMIPDHCLWPAIHGGHPLGRRCATLKMAPGHLFIFAAHRSPIAACIARPASYNGRPFLPMRASMTDPIRLSKRLIEEIGCSRREAELYIEGGWVTVDGVVVEEPQFKVAEQRVELLPNAVLTPVEPITLLLNVPNGHSPDRAVESISPASHWPDDGSGIRPLKSHFARLTSCIPLQAGADGLQWN